MFKIGDLVELTNIEHKKKHHGIVTDIRDLSNQRGGFERELLIMWYDHMPTVFGKKYNNFNWVPSDVLKLVS